MRQLNKTAAAGPENEEYLADLAKNLFLADDLDSGLSRSPKVKLIMPSDPRPMSSY